MMKVTPTDLFGMKISALAERHYSFCKISWNGCLLRMIFMFIDEIIKYLEGNEFLNTSLLTKHNKNRLYYAVKQPDGNIKVVLPFIFENKNFLKLSEYREGIEGATQRVIEEIKQEIVKKKGFLPAK